MFRDQTWPERSAWVRAWWRSSLKHPPLKHVKQTSIPSGESLGEVRREPRACSCLYIPVNQNIGYTPPDAQAEKAEVAAEQLAG